MCELLNVTGLSVSIRGASILDDVSFSAQEGQWLMVVGPNGAGKSTLLNAITQGIDHSGEVLFRGTDVRKMKSVERARLIGVLKQQHAVGYSFSVEEIVRLGRYSHRQEQSIFSGRREADEKAVSEALERAGLTALRDRSVLTLSGGELQRTFLAQVFAQDPQLLLLDEPTNHLDIIYQKQIFALIREWLKEPGRAVVSVVHDLSLARAYGTHALLLDRGSEKAFGSVGEVFRDETLNAVYGMDVRAWMQKLLGQWAT